MTLATHSSYIHRDFTASHVLMTPEGISQYYFNSHQLYNLYSHQFLYPLNYTNLNC